MPKRLLIVNRRLALAPGSRRVVLFDPATGAGGECCCGAGGGPCSGLCGSAVNAIGRCDGGTVCRLDTTTGTPIEATRWRFDFTGSGSTIGFSNPILWSASGSVEVGWMVEGANCVFQIIAASGSASYTSEGNPPIVTPLNAAFWASGLLNPVLYLNQFRLRDFASAVTAFNLTAFGAFVNGPVSPCNLTYTEGTAPDQIRWTRTYSSTCSGGTMAANFTTIPVASFRGSMTFSCGITIIESCAPPPLTCNEWQSLWLAGDPRADLNGDGFVDAIDLDEIIRRYCV